ncbi:hypothetical protein [Parashewanella tropica]|uniref:hypothetical protein n=1 Tax=Parashewanella tropica TaxID=2547970 RepID=UPI00105931CE|nr:hypothetical protein [Parashewanella tropica]
MALVTHSVSLAANPTTNEYPVLTAEQAAAIRRILPTKKGDKQGTFLQDSNNNVFRCVLTNPNKHIYQFQEQTETTGKWRTGKYSYNEKSPLARSLTSRYKYSVDFPPVSMSRAYTLAKPEMSKSTSSTFTPFESSENGVGKTDIDGKETDSFVIGKENNSVHPSIEVQETDTREGSTTPSVVPVAIPTPVTPTRAVGGASPEQLAPPASSDSKKSPSSSPATSRVASYIDHNKPITRMGMVDPNTNPDLMAAIAAQRKKSTEQKTNN